MVRARSAPVRQKNHAKNGQFTTGNRAAGDRAIVAVLKKAGLGGRDVRRGARALLKVLPSDAAPVKALAHEWSNALIFSAVNRSTAIKLGVDTPDGMRAQSLALAWDQRAERLLVTAWDIANRLADAAYLNAAATVVPPWLKRVGDDVVPALVVVGDNDAEDEPEDEGENDAQETES